MLNKQHTQELYMRASRIGGIEDKFWGRVDKLGPNECWNWTGGKSGGYGVIGGVLNGKRYVPVGQNMLAHRVSWIIANGDIPEVDGSDDAHGTVVRHTCDNPLCVNPGHLVIGTQAQNIKDMWDRKRASVPTLIGADHPNARFKDERILDFIRTTDVPAPVLADAFGCDRSVINKIRSGKSYSDR